MSSESQVSEEIMEIREEKVQNPDGTFTIKTIKTIMVEESEEEEEEEGLSNGNTETLADFGKDGMSQLTEEERKEFQVLQAQRKWLDSMAGGGEGVDDAEEKPKKKKKRAEGDKKSKKKKKTANGKENKDGSSSSSSSSSSDDSDQESSRINGVHETDSIINSRFEESVTKSEFTVTSHDEFHQQSKILREPTIISQDKTNPRNCLSDVNLLERSFSLEKERMNSEDSYFEELRNNKIDGNDFEIVRVTQNILSSSSDESDSDGEAVEDSPDPVVQFDPVAVPVDNPNSSLINQHLNQVEGDLDNINTENQVQENSIDNNDQFLPNSTDQDHENIQSVIQLQADIVNYNHLDEIPQNNIQIPVIAQCENQLETNSIILAQLEPYHQISNPVEDDGIHQIIVPSEVAAEVLNQVEAENEIHEFLEVLDPIEADVQNEDQAEGDTVECRHLESDSSDERPGDFDSDTHSAGIPEENFDIDVRKLANTFFSAGEGGVTPSSGLDDIPDDLPNISALADSFLTPHDHHNSSTLPDDLPENMPSISSLVNNYGSPLAPSDTSAPDDVPEGVSLKDIMSTYLSVASTPEAPTSEVARGTPIGRLPQSPPPPEPVPVSNECRACTKQVFQMEKIVAEKAAYHKNCFRCSTCSKTLTLESYQSHEGTLFCKPHFKELFRPKAVVEDEAAIRKERMLRRPKMIVLESNPEVLPDDVVRATAKPDYGLEELGALNVRDRFSMFEEGEKMEDKALETVHVKRSQSMISRAARFLRDDGQESGEEDSDLDQLQEEEEGSEEEGEEEVDEDGNVIESEHKHRKKMNGEDLAEMKEKRTRREENTRKRKDELGRFRQMLCAGKNTSLKEMFESGKFENGTEKISLKEEINIDESGAAKGLKEKFEKGLITEAEYANERAEVEEVFRDAETANKARNLFKKIDSAVAEDGSASILRSQSFGGRENRRSSQEGLVTEDVEFGRDPNLIKCTDNYQDEVDCRNTKNVLNMFKKLESKYAAGESSEEEGESEYEDDETYSDEGEYTSEDGEEDDDEECDDEESKEKYKDEILQMSAKKAASLRAKFEKWEAQEDKQNEHNKEGDEVMPSLDSTRNLKAMFENKAQEASKVHVRDRAKVNRFV